MLIVSRNRNKMQQCKFLLELSAPTNPENIPKLYQKIQNLVTLTGRVGIISKPFGKSIPGFDRSYNLANFLLKRHPQLEVLYHLTCHDLNKVNIQSRVASLERLGIKRLLIVSGDGYELAEDPNLSSLQFTNSHELAQSIMSNFNCFESIAVAGYPGGNGRSSFNNEQECERLSRVLRLGISEIYTQCVFDIDTFLEFDRMIQLKFPQVRAVPSVALFKSSLDLNKIANLTRVSGARFQELKSQLEQVSSELSEEFSFEYLSNLCARLATRSKLVDLSTFGHFELAESLVKRFDFKIAAGTTLMQSR